MKNITDTQKAKLGIHLLTFEGGMVPQQMAKLMPQSHSKYSFIFAAPPFEFIVPRTAIKGKPGVNVDCRLHHRV